MIRLAFPSAGLISGPLAWGASMQLNYSLASWQCAAGARPTPWISLLAVPFALAGAYLSWRAFAAVTGEADGSAYRLHTRRFLAVLGIAAAVLFALIILLQAFAGFVFTGCER